MFDYLHLLLFLLTPILIHRLPTWHNGLVTGLFVSLLTWGRVNPWLVTVPFSAALFLFFETRRHQSSAAATSSEAPQIYIKKPSQPLFAAFLIIMSIFCSFGHFLPVYGNYLQLPHSVMQSSTYLHMVAGIAGPIVFGYWCDRRGPFGVAVFLTFLAELAIWFAASGEVSSAFWMTGIALMSLTLSGFFVLMPVIAEAFFGKTHFLQIYPFTALTSAIAWSTARFLYHTTPAIQQNPGDMLITLIFLPLFAATFIFIAWQRRFVLVGAVKN